MRTENAAKDTFYDAVPYPPYCFDNHTLFATDTITPHPSEFKNPIPLPFLKVGPGITYRFDFHLHNSQLIPALTIEKKRRLFVHL